MREPDHRGRARDGGIASQPKVPTAVASHGGDQAIPFFNQAPMFEELWPQLVEHVDDIVGRSKYSQGHKVAEFERAVQRYTGARHAIAVNNGTDALVLLLRACGVEPGDEVVVPAFTFIASATSVALAGATPVFADIDPDTYAIDVDSLARAITPRTRAVMPVHLFWQMADMDAVCEMARRHDIMVVEDSAEAIGMRWNGVHAGLLGKGGTLSFFPTKTLGAIGDAGMILTDDAEVARLSRMMRRHGWPDADGDPLALTTQQSQLSGTNSKMDELQAAILLTKLGRLDRDIARRAELAEAYSQRLADIPGILKLPRVVARNAETNPVFYVYLIEVERRDELEAYLTGRGIVTETYYPIPLHQQPCFADLGYRPGDFPNAEAACKRTIALPFYPDLTLEEVDRVCHGIRDFSVGRNK
ncbi:DegT/DnrJ/EryC1/StrS family aminotransferase [Actinomadura alba]|uniref:DegT/DnrJ/EryC1/StrS family aminotransferase n=1 Tax=Actinomadura alba TaxID=406431 RepID=A0ABR7LU91_9ACTN|nr:DegT/DnrJ/EryC1/StrS family aminotransferase [Actinomadura alba]MBC6468409.1 DegT/DnrJ/EryC1/StrS family aminotransferase [Actinomadura alba]